MTYYTFYTFMAMFNVVECLESKFGPVITYIIQAINSRLPYQTLCRGSEK